MNNEFKVTKLHERIYQIENDIGNCCTLVVGTEKAILFDTMCGFGDLRSCVEGLTRLPIIVINSHGHYDHMGGNYQFEMVYMNHADKSIIHNTLPYLDVIQSNMQRDLSNARLSYSMMDKLINIEPGMTFELGELTAHVVCLKGHTAGSIGLHIPELRMLLVGDAVSPQMCLFFPDCLGLEEYKKTLRMMMDMDFEYFIQGHYSRLFPKSILKKFWDCTELPGKKRGYEYVNSHIPEYRGTMYLLELRNPEIDSMICLIDKEQKK